MNLILFTSLMFSTSLLPALAEEGDHATAAGPTTLSEDNHTVSDIHETSEFTPDATPGSGFLTSVINNTMERAIASTPIPDGKPIPSRTLSDYMSTPKFGGYFIGKYGYTDQSGKHGGDGFSQRLIRLYVDGTILGDFKYRMQVQVNNSSFHMKDYFIEWTHWKELSIKVGQYKRAFLFENPYNPFDVGAGDYSQIARILAGVGEKENGVANGGRDQGIQLQGDLFPAKGDGHRYLHYQLQMMNGQGINSSDVNARKDFLGTLQFQPVKDLFLGIFGWTGNYVSNGITVDRNRWAAALKYEHNDWTVRAEYAHSQGYRISDYNATTQTFSGTGRADGWYAMVGVPCNKWLKVYAKYDAYRNQATWESNRTMYSLIPNVQLHKNLLMQLQYNYVHDRTSADKNYNELWAEVYVRF